MGTGNLSISRFLLLFLAVLVVGAGVWMFTHQSAVVAKMNEWKLLPQDELFTELYLNNHLDLPKEIAKGQTVSFSFTIHNLEGKSVKYPYVVYLQTDKGARISIAHNAVTLADKESKIINEEYTFKTQITKPVTIFIKLPNTGESLHFFLPSTI